MAKILIVDDSLVARMSLKSCIPKDQGYELFEAVNGQAALEIFPRIRPDVTFLDLTMPDINGIQVMEALQKDFPQDIFIVLSADIQKQTKEKVMSMGAFAMIKKPPVKVVVQEELAKALVAAEGNHV